MVYGLDEDYLHFCSLNAPLEEASEPVICKWRKMRKIAHLNRHSGDRVYLLLVGSGSYQVIHTEYNKLTSLINSL